MTDKTKQKIVGAALELFAEKGYKGATTLTIAEKSGFSEKTLFRKFETKKNLFSSVLIQNYEKMTEDFDSIIIDREFENSRDFLETLIKNLVKLGEDNFEFIKLTVNESNRIPGNFLEEFVNDLSEYVEKNIQNNEIDYRVFVFNLLSFIYLLLLDYGHVFMDHNDAVKKFINNSVLCV